MHAPAATTIQTDQEFIRLSFQKMNVKKIAVRRKDFQSSKYSEVSDVFFTSVC